MAAPLEGAHGTLVCRGTPVEKHCIKDLCFHFSSYVTSLPENAVEGTPLVFEGGLDKVQDLDKVKYALDFQKTTKLTLILILFFKLA